MAILNPKDALHEYACKVVCPPHIVTTVAVQLEVMDAFSAPPHRALASQFWSSTSNNPDITVVEISKGLLESAAKLFDGRPDKAWSFTDCLSFTVIQARGIFEALTADHHFEQAGFRALLRE